MKNFIPKNTNLKDWCSRSMLFLMVCFVTNANAQSEISVNPFDNTNNYHPIQRIVYLENGVTRVNQTSEAANNTVINSNTNSMILDSVIINTSFNNNTPLVLNFINNAGLRVRNINLSDATTGVGVANANSNVLANNNISNSAFQNALATALLSADIKTKIWYDGTSNLPCQGQQPPQCNTQDFDVVYSQSWSPADFLLVSERWGNSTFKLRALDSVGSVIATANTLAFGSGGGGIHERYDWNSGYANGLQNANQSMAFTVVSVSLFNTNGVGIYGFRIFNGQDEADINFFGLSATSFHNNASNPLIGGLSGNIFNDVANNNSGVGIHNPDSTQLYVNVTLNGLVVTSSTVNVDGTYHCTPLENGHYDLFLSTVKGVLNHPTPPNFLPTQWVNTIDFNIIGDGNPNGCLISIEVANDVQTIQINFGIQQRPFAGDGNPPTPYAIDCNVPQGTYIPMPSNPFLGHDYDGGKIVGVIVKTWPTNLEGLMHNDTTYYEHQANMPMVCPTNTCLTFPVNGILIYYNFNGDGFNCPVNILLANGSDSVTINYSVYDNAGFESIGCVELFLNCFTIPLAVGCDDFKGVNNSGIVDLSWNTSSEKNNSGFRIERSQNGQAFHEINFVDGAGNSTLSNSYSIIDYNPFSGNNYYRLISIDENQKEMVECKVIQVNVGTKSSAIQLYPNPSRGVVYFNKGLEVVNQVELLDASGKMLMSEVGNLTELNFEHLVQGIYYLRIRTESNVTTHKLLNVR